MHRLACILRCSDVSQQVHFLCQILRSATATPTAPPQAVDLELQSIHAVAQAVHPRLVALLLGLDGDELLRHNLQRVRLANVVLLCGTKRWTS